MDPEGLLNEKTFYISLPGCFLPGIWRGGRGTQDVSSGYNGVLVDVYGVLGGYTQRRKINMDPWFLKRGGGHMWGVQGLEPTDHPQT